MVGLYEEPLEGEVVYKASKIPGATSMPLVMNTPEGLLELQLQLKFMMAMLEMQKMRKYMAAVSSIYCLCLIEFKISVAWSYSDCGIQGGLCPKRLLSTS